MLFPGPSPPITLVSYSPTLLSNRYPADQELSVNDGTVYNTSVALAVMGCFQVMILPTSKSYEHGAVGTVGAVGAVAFARQVSYSKL